VDFGDFGRWEREGFPSVRFPQANQCGQLTTTPTLQESSGKIFALGDLADCRDAEGQQVPTMACLLPSNKLTGAGWNLSFLTNRPCFLPPPALRNDDARDKQCYLHGFRNKTRWPFSLVARRLAYSGSDANFRSPAKVGFKSDHQSYTRKF